MAGCCESDSEPSGRIKYWEFLDWLRNCQLLKEDFASLSLLVDELYMQCLFFVSLLTLW